MTALICLRHLWLTRTFGARRSSKKRREPGYFTRHRDLSFTHLLTNLLLGCGDVQSELDALFGSLDRRRRMARLVTTSAFSNAHARLRVTLFDSFDGLLRLLDKSTPSCHSGWSNGCWRPMHPKLV